MSSAAWSAAVAPAPLPPPSALVTTCRRCPCPAGNVIATSPYDIALKPFFGIYGPYRRAADPWAYPDNRAFLREFYSKTVAWVGRPKTYRWARRGCGPL